MGGMPSPSYATVQNLRERYSEAELRQTSDAYGQAVDEGRLQTALNDAGDEIDGYLATRYQLPLMNAEGAEMAAPTALVRGCCDIAMYRLQTMRPADDVKDARRRYEDVLALLKRYRDGELELIGAQLVPVLPGGVGGGSVEFNIPAVPPYSPFARSER